MPIAYPKFFEELLQRDRSLRAGVDGMVVAFDGWLSSSRLPFFTDYTDHGIDHLNCVLGTADHLISDVARAVFTPSDAAVLICAILLHDSAMHLSETGFYALIRGEASKWNNPGFPDRPWPTLWDEFLFSAKRWDERRLRDVLGETPTGEPRAQVRDPFANYDNLSDTDRKLIGEFIRRHHTRMAHEFACHGVPGPTVVNLGVMLRADLRDISGLVARSHGLPVRACLEYLQKRYHRREHDGVHAVYLMTLLRVSDYLQIQAERAPAIVFQYRHIPSKLSELEWEAHNAISNITQTHDDPESIEIQAHPQDVYTYLRLKEWLSGIQEELDASWAVLGETYGSHPKLSRLGLILRRVRSNLDHMDAFSRQVSYVPERIELTVARPDLLKLLVGPLYENVPSIGVRELTQNAVDAVRERQVLQQKHPELCKVPLIDQENDVEIVLESPDERGYAWLTVSDRGAGMSVEIIRDYFLTAGASFRNSDAWKQEFETEDSPHSRVLRSGRFGVGVLAGFLLGSRMEVATRHIRSESGVRFSTTLDLNAIELCHDLTLRVGTIIRIQVSRTVRQKLLESSARVSVPEKYDWFVYDRPSVARFVGQERKKLEQAFAVAPPDPKKPSSFRRLRGSYDYSVYWTYRPLPSLSVNGLFITDSVTRRRFARRRHWDDGRIRNWEYSASNDGMKFSISHPKIWVEDPDGTFPLNLRRSDITEREYPFKSTLITDIIDDFLAYLLVHCPQNPSDERWLSIDQHPGVHFDMDIAVQMFKVKLYPFLTSTEGITLFSPRLQTAIKGHTVFFLFPSAPLGIIDASRQSNSVLSIAKGFTPPSYGSSWPREILPSDIPFLAPLDLASTLRTASNTVRNSILGNRRLAGVRLLLPTRIARKVEEPDRWIAEMKSDCEKEKAKDKYWSPGIYKLEQFIQGLCNQLKIEKTVSDYSFVASQGCPETQLNSVNLNDGEKDFYALEACVAPDTLGDSPGQAGPITERWEEIIRQPIIPFDPAARRRDLKHAYEALRQFILSHEAMKQESVLY